MDDLQAQYSFLMLMTLHTDWGGDPGKHLREISPAALEEFCAKHPLAVHQAREEPAPLPASEPTLTDLDAPLFTRPKLGMILSEGLIMLEDKMAEAAGVESPNDGHEPATGLAEALGAAPGLRYNPERNPRDYAPRDHMQEQLMDQVHVHAREMLGLMDATDRDQLEELVGRTAVQRESGEQNLK